MVETQTEWECLVPPGTPLVIHGAGNLCRQLFEQFSDTLKNEDGFEYKGHINDHPLWAVCDNDPAKYAKPIIDNSFWFRVCKPEECVPVYENSPVIYVILVHLGAEDVRQQLIGLGVPPERIVHWWTLWQHFDTLKVPAWADVPPHPENWLDVWSDEASRQVVRDAYDFFKTYSDRTAVYKPRAAYSLPENIYFDEMVYRRLPDERFLDCGAFDGDTVQAFHETYSGHYSKIVAVEASPENYRKLAMQRLWHFQSQSITYLNAALVGDPSIETIQFSGHGVSACIGGGMEVCAVTIDKLCARYDFHPSLVKLDIEGAELDTLHGAVETIKRNRPVIACCLYHHPRDLWEISAFLAGVCEDYRFYARCYEDMGWETIMYAVPKERSVA
jgi:FkbM family methyltransferase